MRRDNQFTAITALLGLHVCNVVLGTRSCEAHLTFVDSATRKGGTKATTQGAEAKAYSVTTRIVASADDTAEVHDWTFASVLGFWL